VCNWFLCFFPNPSLLSQGTGEKEVTKREDKRKGEEMTKEDLEREIYLLELESIDELEERVNADGGETVLPL